MCQVGQNGFGALTVGTPLPKTSSNDSSSLSSAQVRTRTNRIERCSLELGHWTPMHWTPIGVASSSNLKLVDG